MTESRHFSNTVNNNGIGFSSLFSLSAIFIAFATLAVMLCTAVPFLRETVSLPVNEAALSYQYTDIEALLCDSLIHSAKQLAVLLAYLLCAYSVFCKAVLTAANALNGFCFGCLLFYSVSKLNVDRGVAVFLLFHAAAYALTIIFSSMCVYAQKDMLTLSKSSVLKSSAGLIFAFLSFGGACCLLKLLELLFL